MGCVGSNLPSWHTTGMCTEDECFLFVLFSHPVTSSLAPRRMDSVWAWPKHTRKVNPEGRVFHPDSYESDQLKGSQ